MTSNVTSPGPAPTPEDLMGKEEDSWDVGEPGRLEATEHNLDVTVWLVIGCIFTFFFIIVITTLCLHWLEHRRQRNKEYLVLPAAPVPGCFTIMATNEPHFRLLTHYHLLPCQYGATRDTVGKPLLFSPDDRYPHVPAAPTTVRLDKEEHQTF